MTIDEARDHIGHGVAYRPEGGKAEDGEIIRISGGRFVMVLYRGDLRPKATYPADLALLDDDTDFPSGGGPDCVHEGVECEFGTEPRCPCSCSGCADSDEDIEGSE